MWMVPVTMRFRLGVEHETFKRKKNVDGPGDHALPSGGGA